MVDNMIDDKPIFEILYKDGMAYRFWADGRTEGFDPGFIMVNRASPLVNLAKGLTVKLRNCGMITAEEASCVLS